MWSDKSREVIFEIGSDDGVKVWVNYKLVHQNNVERGHEPGSDKANGKLKKGWNTVLVKITHGVGGWAASLVITDPQGEIIDGLKYK